MRRSPDFYRRLALIALENDAVRVGTSLLMLAVLALAGLPLVMTLILPLVTYGGCCLLAQPRFILGLDRWRRSTTGSAGEAHAACTRIRLRIDAHAGLLQDAESTAHARRIAARIDQSLGVIAADGRHQVTAALLGLAETTDRLLTAYLKVVDRGFGCAELRERLRDNLAALDGELERFWVRLNRDTIVDLDALSTTIDVTLNDLGPSSRLGVTS